MTLFIWGSTFHLHQKEANQLIAVSNLIFFCWCHIWTQEEKKMTNVRDEFELKATYNLLACFCRERAAHICNFVDKIDKCDGDKSISVRPKNSKPKSS